MTSLFSGERVPKDLLRVEAYGDVDELNSLLGVLVASLPEDASAGRLEVQQIQSDLFHAGAWLATTPDSSTMDLLQEIREEHWRPLEAAMDRMQDELGTLREFILPGGSMAASIAHVARTVCRRAERHVVRLAQETASEGGQSRLNGVIVYLNRLSDYLFLFARHVNRISGVSDIPWKK